MADLISRLKNMSNDAKSIDSAELRFLEQSDLTLVIDRGFNEIYRLKPENPVLFLSKYLDREAKARELAKKYLEEEQHRSRLEAKFYQGEKKKAEILAKKAQEEKERKDDENNLITEIEECKDFWLGFNHICERLKQLTNATGCYVGIYDNKRRPVTEDDDENDHIDPSNVKVLRYIGWNEDHKFLDGKFLEQKDGVTFDLIFPSQKPQGQEGGEGDKPQGGENNLNPTGEGNKPAGDANKPGEEKEIKPEDTIKTLLIKDVVNENRIKFYREPRLGCYLALDLTYKTSLSYDSLLSAIQCTKDYEAAKLDQETRKKAWSDEQEDYKKQIKEIEEERQREEEAKRQAEEKALEAERAKAAAEGGEPDPNAPPQATTEDKKKEVAQSQNIKKSSDKPEQGQEPQEEDPIEVLKKKLTEWTEPPVELAEYKKDETKIYICLDTLGQDRVFTETQVSFIKKIGATIRDSMEKLEQSLLEKDRDLNIKFKELEDKIKADDKFSDEKFEEQINLALNQYFASEEYKSKPAQDDTAKEIESDLFRMRYLKENMLEGDFKDALLTFQQFEFVEFSKAFQNLLYFCRVNPLDINEDRTNKLEWKKGRKLWENIFGYIKNYEPLGPKPEEIKNIYKLNKIKENLETAIAKRDEVKAYSQTLLMFIDFLLHIISVRHDDILRRYCNVYILKEKREQIIKINQEIDEERQKIIDAAKAANPNVRVPEEKKEGVIPPASSEGPKEEGGEKKEEEKTNNEEEKKEGGEGAQVPTQGGEDVKIGEEQKTNEANTDEADSLKLAEELAKFDEENVKQEVPEDVEYDVDNDYDIEQSEKDAKVNEAMQQINNNSANPADKPKGK